MADRQVLVMTETGMGKMTIVGLTVLMLALECIGSGGFKTTPATSRMIRSSKWLLSLQTFEILNNHASARDFGQYTNSSDERRKWFKELAPPGLNPEYSSCCDQGDVVHTKFQVNKKDGTDEWTYLAANGKWKVVPPQIILWEKINDPMNDGQARLWVSPYLKDTDGTPTPICFIPPRSGN
jgi:hypothetical protein